MVMKTKITILLLILLLAGCHGPYGSDGYNAEGYNWLGADRDGYGKDGYNWLGYNKDGLSKTQMFWKYYNQEVQPK